MRIIKSQKNVKVQLSQQEWFDIGKKAKWIEIAPDSFQKEAAKKKKKGRCWVGYEPTPGKEPYSDGSCQKK